jgi:hypothetical protein
MDGYDLSVDAQSAAKFIGNERVLVGQVRDVSDPFIPKLPPEVLEKAGEDDESANTLVSRRVDIEVSEVLRGPGREGDSLGLRIFGGTTDDVTLEAESEQWMQALTPGTTIAVFSGHEVAYADGSSMITPNQLFVEREGLFHPVGPARATEPVTIAQIRQYVDSADESRR